MGQNFFIRHPGPISESWRPGKDQHLVDDPLGSIEEVGWTAKIVATVVVPQGQKNGLPQDFDPRAEGAFEPKLLCCGYMATWRADITGKHDAICLGNVQGRQMAVSVAKGQNPHAQYLASFGCWPGLFLAAGRGLQLTEFYNRRATPIWA